MSILTKIAVAVSFVGSASGLRPTPRPHSDTSLQDHSGEYGPSETTHHSENTNGFTNWYTKCWNPCDSENQEVYKDLKVAHTFEEGRFDDEGSFHGVVRCKLYKQSGEPGQMVQDAQDIWYDEECSKYTEDSRFTPSTAWKDAPSGINVVYGAHDYKFGYNTLQQHVPAPPFFSHNEIGFYYRRDPGWLDSKAWKDMNCLERTSAGFLSRPWNYNPYHPVKIICDMDYMSTNDPTRSTR